MNAVHLAEHVLCSAIVAGRDVSAAGALTSDHFHDPRCALLWRAYTALVAKGRRVTPMALREALGAISCESDAPPVTLKHMAGWTSRNTSDDDIREAGEIVMRGYRLRALAGACKDVAAAAAAPAADPDVLTAQLLDAINGVGPASDDLLDMVTLLTTVTDDLKARGDSSPGKGAMPTGVRRLDEELGGGLEPGSVYVVGARPAMGKSAFAMTLALETAKRSFPVLFVSLEMSQLQLGRRVLAASSDRTPLHRLKRIDRPDTWEGVSEAWRCAKDLPVSFVITSGTIESICSTARRWHRQHRRPGLLILDYLQLTSGQGRREGREREVADVSRSVKLLALELDCAVLLLSQLNRSVESRTPPRPRMSDLRESGAIEQDADVVMLLYRPSVYTNAEGQPLASDERFVEVLIVKNREGEPGTIAADFIGEHTRFQDRSEA